MGSWHCEPWVPTLDWDSSSGRLLLKVVEVLKESAPVTISVFGSAPLQLGVDANLVSNDLDILNGPRFHEKLHQAGFLIGQADPYVEVGDETTFTAASGWRDRAFEQVFGNVKIVLPHPIDILVSKVKRMEEKDFVAFETVIRATGHPTEGELIESLQRVVDLYRPSFDEEAIVDPSSNTRLLWQRLFGGDIDVRQSIITPALKARAIHYSANPESLRPFLELREAAGPFNGESA